MGRGAWQATVYGVAKSWTGLSDILSDRRKESKNEWIYMYA